MVQLISAVFKFLKDYGARHSNPLNAFLHLFGVPLAFWGIFKLFDRRSSQKSLGCLCLVLGYLLQYLGHKKQGNEVGEVTLIKMFLAKVSHGGKSAPFESEAEIVNGNGNGHRGSFIGE
jgi:uncharacterized membrane protein YGL010W